MLPGRRLVCPQPALIGRDSYQGDPTPPIYETLEGAAADSDTPVLLWLPGSGQLPDNELLRRLANALHGVGARMVITSAAHGDAAAALAQLHTAGAQRIYLGGHSKGGAEALGMSAAAWMRAGRRVHDQPGATHGRRRADPIAHHRRRAGWWGSAARR